MKIGFIGQGYVGKNYADDFERRGYSVVRFALEEAYKANKDAIRACAVVFIAVPTPTIDQGFDASIVEGVLSLVGRGKIAVIKSTMLPGTTEALQKKFPKITILFSPEFLSEATAAYDAAHPFVNIIGLSKKSKAHNKAAKIVHTILPQAPSSFTCSSTEAELIKYAHNVSGYTQVLTFNVIYDLAEAFGCEWDSIQRGVYANPFISNHYANPVHKRGRGAGGSCFIKDFAALAVQYRTLVGKEEGIAFLEAAEHKNLRLLHESKKDLHIIESVYGSKRLKELSKANQQKRKKSLVSKRK